MEIRGTQVISAGFDSDRRRRSLLDDGFWERESGAIGSAVCECGVRGATLYNHDVAFYNNFCLAQNRCDWIRVVTRLEELGINSFIYPSELY